MRSILLFCKVILAGIIFSSGLALAQSDTLPLHQIRLPQGFKIEVFARVENARQMALGANNTLFVGSMRAGKVHALALDANYQVKSQHLIAERLNMPVGVAFKDGALYVSAVSRILRFDNIESRLARSPAPAPAVVRDDFPTDQGHGWKFIAFGPDGKLYVPVGAPCNVCERRGNRYSNVQRMNADGSALEVVARGVRNTVGFDWHPVTGALWFTDNGRDWLGDNAPPDELNTAPQAGMHFGFPYCHGGTFPDPEFGAASGPNACKNFTAPAQNLGAHVAALGMRFYTGTQFPAAYRNQVFIAEHGSWNRSSKSGYQVSLVRLDAKGERAVSYEPFASGWLQGEKVWGRPADVLVLPDGSLLVADDLAGAIYRITYSGN